MSLWRRLRGTDTREQIHFRARLARYFPIISWAPYYNRHLLNDLIKRKIWNSDVKNELIAHNGSVQDMDCVPADLKEIYKTVLF